MKQKIFYAALLLQFAALQTFSQSMPGTVSFKEKIRPAIKLNLEYEVKTAEETILAKLKETGYKPEKNGNMFNKKNKQEGFYVFNGVSLPELANEKLDLYFKTDAVQDGSNNRSAVTLLVSKGYENFISAENDSSTYAAANAFLNGFVSKTGMHEVNGQLETQKKSLAVSEKKWQDLREKQADATRKISELQSDLKNWQAEELEQQKDVDAQRKALQDLEAKRMAIKQ